MVNMNKISATMLLFFPTLFFNNYINAQENGNPAIIHLRNNININISLFDYTINYERNIIQRPKSYTNFRMGFGVFYLSSMKGYHFNPSWVHLTGKKNNHLELNLGFKYVIEEGSHDSFFNSLLPDIFAGYRYERPSGRFIFRTGINLFTLYNIGIGFKF